MSDKQDARFWQQAIGSEIARQCGIGAGTCGTADDGSGLFEVNASLDLNGFAAAMLYASLVSPSPLAKAAQDATRQHGCEVILEAYDTGLLGDGGGGNIEWWQNYIRHELERAHEFYSEQITGR